MRHEPVTEHSQAGAARLLPEGSSTLSASGSWALAMYSLCNLLRYRVNQPELRSQPTTSTGSQSPAQGEHCSLAGSAGQQALPGSDGQVSPAAVLDNAIMIRKARCLFGGKNSSDLGRKNERINVWPGGQKLL